MKVIKAADSTEAITAARSACATQDVMNLILTFPMELPASNSLPLSPFVEDARRWQAQHKHDEQFFNHGEYMHMFGDPEVYLFEELRRKPTSNRAVISLVNGAQIYTSGDGVLPSFMLVQVGVPEDSNKVLHLTAYYRALEVTSFLQINLAELALIAESLADRLGWFTRAEITIHAFRAHAKPGFNALRRNEIDVLPAVEISQLVRDRKLGRIADLLREKSAPASIIEDAGLAALSNEAALAGWSPELLAELDGAIVQLSKLKQLRESATHGDRVARMEDAYATHLMRAADLVSKE